MNKLLRVIIISLFFSAFISIPMECAGNDFRNDNMIFTIKREVFRGYFERSSLTGAALYTEGGRDIQNITFTKVLSRNKSTGQTELLFEMKRDIKDFYFISGKFYLLTNEGVYTCDINGGNVQLLIDGTITSFAVSDSGIFYSIYNNDIEHFQIMKCDLNSGENVVIVDKTRADKFTIVDGGLIFSDSGYVGKISGENQVDYYITNLVVPMPGGDTGSHFVINNYLIVSGYMSPEDQKYGEYPTIILDLNGNVLGVWENTFVRNIIESNGSIYASIDNMTENGQVQRFTDEEGSSRSTGGTYHVSNDFKERHLVLQSIGFRHMYINANHIFFNRDAIQWFKGDVLPDRAIENIEVEPIEAEYSDDIEVLVLNENPVDEMSADGIQYSAELLTFDVPPKMKNDDVLVPLRRIFESLGAAVDWDDATRTVTTKKNNVELRLQVDTNTLYKNNEGIPLNVSVEIIDGRVLVPFLVVSEGLSARITWDEAKKAVWIWAG